MSHTYVTLLLHYGDGERFCFPLIRSNESAQGRREGGDSVLYCIVLLCIALHYKCICCVLHCITGVMLCIALYHKCNVVYCIAL